MSLDISVEEPEQRKRRNSLPMALFGGAVLVGVGIALVFALRSPTTPPRPPPVLPTTDPQPTAVAPQPTATAPQPTAPTPPAQEEPPSETAQTTDELSAEDLPIPDADEKPAEGQAPKSQRVRFVITSEPSGARVMYAGKSLGQTPVKLDVPVGDSGRASARLTFELNGYTSVTANPEGEGPVIHVAQRLKKKPSSRPSRPSGSNGYKDDPYQ